MILIETKSIQVEPSLLILIDAVKASGDDAKVIILMQDAVELVASAAFHDAAYGLRVLVDRFSCDLRAIQTDDLPVSMMLVSADEITTTLFSASDRIVWH